MLNGEEGVKIQCIVSHVQDNKTHLVQGNTLEELMSRQWRSRITETAHKSRSNCTSDYIQFI